MSTVEAVKEFLVQFGASWVLWLLFCLSAGSVAVAIERWLYFRRKQADVRKLVGMLDGHLRAGAYGAAIEALEQQRSSAAAIACAGLKLRDLGASGAEKGMRGALAVERKGLEMRLVYLGTLGNNAPFIGLFGTVIGVILAFEELGQATAASAATNQAASAAVMSAIAEALVATAVGIGVALPAVAAYNLFQRQLSMLLDDAEALMSLVLAYLSAPDRVSTDPARYVPESEHALDLGAPTFAEAEGAI